MQALRELDCTPAGMELFPAVRALISWHQAGESAAVRQVRLGQEQPEPAGNRDLFLM